MGRAEGAPPRFLTRRILFNSQKRRQRDAGCTLLELMTDLWPADPRLIRTVDAPSGRSYTIRLDGLAHTLATEAESFLATLPAGDAAAAWLTDEVRVATHALRLGITFAFLEEGFGALGFCRVVVESAIRLSWLMTDGPLEDHVRTRLGRLEKRDIGQLLAASKAVAELSVTGPLVENEDELRRHLQAIKQTPAPETRTMAKDGGWAWLYALHRLCSVGIHPGLGARARLWEAVETEGLVQLLHWSYAGTVSASGGVGLALFGSDANRIKMNAMVFAASGEAPPDEVHSV